MADTSMTSRIGYLSLVVKPQVEHFGWQHVVVLKLDVISKGRGKLRNQGSLLLVDNMVNLCASSPFEL